MPVPLARKDLLAPQALLERLLPCLGHKDPLARQDRKGQPQLCRGRLGRKAQPDSPGLRDHRVQLPRFLDRRDRLARWGRLEIIQRFPGQRDPWDHRGRPDPQGRLALREPQAQIQLSLVQQAQPVPKALLGRREQLDLLVHKA